MRLFRLEARQTVAADPASVWDFLVDPSNLAEITPAWLNFRLIDPPERLLEEGLRLEYRITPFFNIPIPWVTEITTVSPPEFFVDQQRSGPFSIWRHEHFLRPAETGAGTGVADVVHYALPLDPLSRPLHEPLIRPRLARIFVHRRVALRRRFGNLPDGEPPYLRIARA